DEGDVDRAVRHLGERAARAGDRRHLPAELLEEELQRGADVLLVIDDERARHAPILRHDRRPRPRGYPPVARAGGAGRKRRVAATYCWNAAIWRAASSAPRRIRAATRAATSRPWSRPRSASGTRRTSTSSTVRARSTSKAWSISAQM